MAILQKLENIRIEAKRIQKLIYRTPTSLKSQRHAREIIVFREMMMWILIQIQDMVER